MEIDVPDLHRQRILVNAYTLMQEEKKILNEIIIRKNNIIKTLIR